MKITEQPIQPGTLTRIKPIGGGHKGILFLLENDKNERLVVKFQKEAPAEALGGTAVMRQVGARTPGVRLANADEIGILSRALEPLKGAHGTDVNAFRERAQDVGSADAKKLRYALLMDYAEGITIKEARDESPEAFLAAICDPGFQFDLGRIAAADTFGGNPDRMFARRDADLGVEGWYHEGNLFLSLDTERRPVAIDNAFNPRLSKFQKLPHGLWNSGVQFGSVSSANQGLSEVEAGHLFDKFLQTTEDAHPELKGDIAKLKEAHRGSFIANFTKGTAAAMQTLLTRGQGWKAQFTQYMADEEMLQQFRVRKRALRQIAAGVEPNAARKTADSTEAYRKWVLTTELKMNEQDATELLIKGIEAYRNAKRGAHR